MRNPCPEAKKTYDTGMFLTAILSIVFGYFAGYLFRAVIKCMYAPMGHKNLRQGGVRWRRWISFTLLVIGAVFDLPLMLFFAGFVLYESAEKWCIFKSLHVKSEE